MTYIETMKRALEALDAHCHTEDIEVREQLRATIEEVEKAEPVIWVDGGHLREVMNGNDLNIYASPDNTDRLIPLYLHPAPSRSCPETENKMWDEEIVEILKAINHPSETRLTADEL